MVSAGLDLAARLAKELEGRELRNARTTVRRMRPGSPLPTATRTGRCCRRLFPHIIIYAAQTNFPGDLEARRCPESIPLVLDDEPEVSHVNVSRAYVWARHIGPPFAMENSFGGFVLVLNRPEDAVRDLESFGY